MSLLSLVQAATLRLGIPKPAAVVSSSDPMTMQLLALAQEEGEELARDFDWAILVRLHTFTTTDAVSEYALPSDFDRILNRTEWDRANGERLRGPIDPVQWQAIKSGLIGEGIIGRRYRIMRAAASPALKFTIDPTPDTSSDNETLAFEYVSNAWALDDDGTTALSAWAADTDTALLPERLITLGLKWRWRRAKGLEYGMELAEYEQARDIAKANDKPASPVNIGGRRRVFWPPYPVTPETGFGP